MSTILTLVSSSPDKPVAGRHIGEVSRLLDNHNIMFTCAPVWLAPGKAVDLGVSDAPHSAAMTHITDFLDKTAIDIFISDPDRRRKKLLLADMDSTIVDAETLDELADYAGLKEKIAAITALAMEGKLDFNAALRERVGLLKDLNIEAMQKTLERMKLNPGAESLIRTMKKGGAKCVLVSGGFTFFTGAIAKQTGFDTHHGNTLEIHNDKLTGKVIDPILDKFSKADFLRTYVRDMKIKPEDVMAIGDGANDIPMLKAAGLGVGYKPKDAVKKEIDNLIIHGDLTAALYAQGYTKIL
ncbi:MAG: phosphoserine phosphatase SerB [Alphaproteobacteria bacterium PRO2]|nr:phosphoserine phosphatase SerB [Alphaproteobacteria bacterium PRO2]